MNVGIECPIDVWVCLVIAVLLAKHFDWEKEIEKEIK